MGNVKTRKSEYNCHNDLLNLNIKNMVFIGTGSKYMFLQHEEKLLICKKELINRYLEHEIQKLNEKNIFDFQPIFGIEISSYNYKALTQEYIKNNLEEIIDIYLQSIKDYRLLFNSMKLTDYNIKNT